jgi:phosphoglycolate phosphatase-like HAD superfamily hydrolase
LALAGVRVVFIDDGGILNDNERRAPEWRRLLGEYLPPRLGGTAQAWAQSNIGAAERSWARYLKRVAPGNSFAGIEAWRRADLGEWLVDMCRQVGVAPPADPAAFAAETAMWVPEHVRSDIPGATRAVHRLAGRGLTLHMASGGLSWELAPYLRGMGIRERFDRLYGPDLVDTTKNGPHYYAAILADSRTYPAAAAVVDDSADARAWASAVGLRPYSSLADLVAAFE